MTSDPKGNIESGIAEYERLLAEARRDLEKSKADDASDDAAYEARIAELNKTIEDLKSSRAETLFGFYAGNVGATGGARANYDFVRKYLGDPQVYRMFFSGPPPKSFVGSVADFGPPVVVSFKLPPKEVVTGKHDALMKGWWDSIPTDRKVWWSYFHEPENDIEAGAFSTAEYRAAWDHLVRIAPVRDNLVPTLILMRYTLSIPTRRTVAWYVSEELKRTSNGVLAWDTYLTGTLTVKQCVQDPAEVSASFGLDFAIGEASAKDAAKRDGYAVDLTRVAKEVNAKFVTWFESDKSSLGGNEADWRLKAGTPGASAWKANVSRT